MSAEATVAPDGFPTNAPVSVERDAQLADDRPELRDLPAQHGVLLGGRRADGFGRDFAEALDRLGMAHRRRRLALQPVDDLARRPGAGEESGPALGLELGEAGLPHRP